MALHKISVKMVNMWIVKVTYRVTPYVINARAQTRNSEYARFECEDLWKKGSKNNKQ